MSDFKDIWQNADTVSEEGNPFYYLSIEGSHSFSNPNTLFLKDNDYPSQGSGRVYLIVKPEYQCRFQIRTKKMRAFTGVEFDDYTKDAYDMDFDSPWTNATGYQSSLTFDARGGSMIAIAVDFDRGVWSKKDDVFHRETVNRGGITQPEDLTLGGGILLSLTAPYENWTTDQTSQFIFQGPDSDTQLILLGFSKKVDSEGEVVSTVPTVGEVVDETDENYGENIVTDSEKWDLVQRYNVTDKSSRAHTVSVWKESDISTTTYGDGRGATQDWVLTYWVFVDNTQESFYGSHTEAMTAAQLRVQQVGELGLQSGGGDPTNVVDVVTDIAPDVSTLALAGGGIFVMVLIVVFVAMFAKGKGGA